MLMKTADRFVVEYTLNHELLKTTYKIENILTAVLTESVKKEPADIKFNLQDIGKI